MLTQCKLSVYDTHLAHSLAPQSYARVPATCGELMQGYLDGHDFLINSPIALYAEVCVELNQSGEVEVESLLKSPKIKTAVSDTLARLGSAAGAKVTVHSRLPRGKGLASSTSEIAAAILATADALQVNIPLQVITDMLLKIDRSTDAVHLPGIVMTNHLQGTVFEFFGEPPPLSFLLIDTGGEVSTMGFDRVHARAVAHAQRGRLRNAVKCMQTGFLHSDARLIGLAATESARINQGVLYKECLEDVIRLSLDAGAVGVNCAHTGTVLGVMYDHRHVDVERLKNSLVPLVGDKAILGNYRLIAGGR